jgi:hypothetical protein
MSGLRDTLKIGGAKLASLAGHYEGVSTLNAVNMLGYSGDTDNFALGRAIWDDRIQVRYSKDVKAADGYYGAYNGTDTPNEIQLSSDLLGTGKELAAKLAAVMAHEGTHVAGNRYEAVAHQQGLQTYGALLETFGLQGDSAFALGMIAALMDPVSYKENESSKQNMEIRVYANGTHKIFDNKQKALTFTYLNAEGDKVGGYTIDDPSIQTMPGRAAALAKIWGLEKIEDQLGSSLNSTDTYDYQTLKDVLGLSDAEIRKVQRSGTLPNNITEAQRLSLAGEALLKRAGGVWDTTENVWTGMDLSLTNTVLPGGLYGWLNEQGTYEFAAASMNIIRNPLSYFVRNSKEAPNLAYAGKDSVEVTQWDLEGNMLMGPQRFNGFTSVQTKYNTEEYGYDAFVQVPWSLVYNGHGIVNVGPETLMKGDIGFVLLQYPDNSKIDLWGIAKDDPYLRAIMGTIMAGTRVKPDGSTNLSNASIAMHPTINFGNTGCPVTGNWNGQTGVTLFTNFTSYLTNNLNLPYGYVLYGKLIEQNNPYIKVGR